MLQLFDTHAHLDADQFNDLDQIVANAVDAGVIHMMAIGTTAVSSAACVQLAERYDQVFAAIGIQPNHVAEAVEGDWQRVVDLVQHPMVRAIGETGLDRYWDDTPFPQQQDYFDRHLSLAQQHHLPVVIHMRECGDDVVEMLESARQRGPLRGVMHSFTGDTPLAEKCMALGLHISFAGMVTYKKSDELREVASCIPDDRLLIETDSPYLSPHPHRGHRPNEPAMVVHTCTCLAEVRKCSLNDLAALTTRNAKALFAV